MPWRDLIDTANRENPNAGNGGDLGKHTVYLAVLEYLLPRSPWSDGLRVRECHAGRGMYRIPDPDPRRRLLECLYEPVNADVGVLLHDVQRASQSALNVWPPQPAALKWYSGSAVVNAWQLASTKGGKHLLQLYELEPDTRAILRAVFAAPKTSGASSRFQILPDPDNGGNFDGELHIENNVLNWDSQDLILLDPFAMWRQDEHQQQRDRYRRILEQVIGRGKDSPLLILFWVWGQRHHQWAVGDLQGTAVPVLNGYAELRALLHQANRQFIRVVWCWGQQFAIWIIVPDSHLNALCAALQQRCDELRDHLQQQWPHIRRRNPNIEVIVD